MRAARNFLVAIGACGAVLAAAAALPASGARAGDPARVQIVEKEFSLTLSRLRVHSGQAIVQLVNFGMDNHDLVIQANTKGTKPLRFAQLSPGDHSTKTVKLARGHYTLWCSLPQHRKLGMVATIVVT